MDAILLSGGMDSIALAAWVRPSKALTIDYGQLCADAELRAARQASEELGIEHSAITVDCRDLGSGDLAGTKASSLAGASDWWPFRNQLLVTLAAAWAIKVGTDRLMLGTVKTDSSHLDGTPQFIRLIDGLLQMQEGSLRVEAPAIGFSTAELVRKSGIELSVLAWAHSCHKANYACGLCRGCQKHREVMTELGYGAY